MTLKKGRLNDKVKHFIIKITYKVPLNKIDKILVEHRKFLQEGFSKGMLLFSGPQNPRTGGIVAARAKTTEEIKLFFESDPYKINNYADYEITEFDIVKRQPLLDQWVSDE